jgi:hypothetical protein
MQSLSNFGLLGITPAKPLGMPQSAPVGVIRTLSLAEAQAITKSSAVVGQVPVVGRSGAVSPSPAPRPQTSADDGGLTVITEAQAARFVPDGSYLVRKADGSTYRLDRGTYYRAYARKMRMARRPEEVARRLDRERQRREDLFAC